MEKDLITRNFLVGLLRSRYEDVNIVNAPAIFKERGVEISETSSDRRTRFMDLIVVEVSSKRNTNLIAGTVSIDRQPRIVDINGYAFDLVPRGPFIMITHHDQPGVIGKVGTLLGNNNINIAGMQVGRQSVRGNAIMAINIDDEITPDIVNTIKRYKGIKTVNLIEF